MIFNTDNEMKVVMTKISFFASYLNIYLHNIYINDRYKTLLM